MSHGISVVIPAYNEEKFLPRAIKSVLNQTVKPDEILVIDDGSTDNTRLIAESFGESVRCVHQENGGLSSARNLGIRSSKFEYVAILDADDEWLPEHLELAMRSLTGHNDVSWFCGSVERRAEDGSTLFVTGPNRSPGCFYEEDYFRAQAEQGVLANSSAMVIRKSVFDEVGVFNESLKRGGEDHDLWYRIALAHPRIGRAAPISVIYWRREGSIMARRLADPAYFLSRILTTCGAAERAGGDALKRSSPLLKRWSYQLIQYAIEMGDRKILREICTVPQLPLGRSMTIFLQLMSLLPQTLLQRGFLLARAAVRVAKGLHSLAVH
jgi:glycosyltransferase involved in cell wall biosynthesis